MLHLKHYNGVSASLDLPLTVIPAWKLYIKRNQKIYTMQACCANFLSHNIVPQQEIARANKRSLALTRNTKTRWTTILREIFWTVFKYFSKKLNDKKITAGLISATTTKYSIDLFITSYLKLLCVVIFHKMKMKRSPLWSQSTAYSSVYKRHNVQGKQKCAYTFTIAVIQANTIHPQHSQCSNKN